MRVSNATDDDLEELLRTSWESRRQVVTVGGEATTEGWELSTHSHTKAQLMLVLSGVVTCEVDKGIWLVPPGSAIFIAGGLSHRLAIAGDVRSYVALIQEAVAPQFAAKCCTITVTPLLRELILRTAEFSMDGEPTPLESQVCELLLSEVSAASTGELHLPMPSDSRLRTIFEGIMADPSERGTIESWARQSGLSQRTLERLIAAETGMSFGRWRRQLNLLIALRWMAEGRTVEGVALDLGYESSGSFVTMFRKALGSSPGRYMSVRRNRL